MPIRQLREFVCPKFYAAFCDRADCAATAKMRRDEATAKQEAVAAGWQLVAGGTFCPDHKI